MKISTKSRYGLRALVDLAVHSMGEPVALMHIAKRQDLSINYLEQVFSLLKKANIIKSIKGPQGGYILGLKPNEITVADVIKAIEGEILIVEVDALDNKASLLNQNMQLCLQHHVWDKMTESVRQVTESITLEELMKAYQEKARENTIMYYI